MCAAIVCPFVAFGVLAKIGSLFHPSKPAAAVLSIALVVGLYFSQRALMRLAIDLSTKRMLFACATIYLREGNEKKAHRNIGRTDA